MNGEEWKAGTPYEDAEDKLARAMFDAFLKVEVSMKAWATALKSFSGSIVALAKANAIWQLEMRGTDSVSAAAAVEECAMLAAAEGRTISRALKALVESTPRIEPNAEPD